MRPTLSLCRRGAPHDPECDCRAAETSVEGRLQGPPLPGIADLAGGLLVSALSLELPRHRGAVLERGLPVAHSTLTRWVLSYAPLIERRLRSSRKPHCGSLCIDQT